MYLRPIRVVELEKWLLDKGFAEEKPGYGHVDAKELAEALISEFDVLTYSAVQ